MARDLVRRDARVHMHVVPSILVQQGAPHRALEREPDLLRDPTGPEIRDGVVNLQAMETELAESPA